MRYSYITSKFIYLFLEPSEIHGVVRQAWSKAITTSKRLKDDVVFKKKPNISEDVLESLLVPRDFADNYAQKLSTFLQVLGNVEHFIILYLCYPKVQLNCQILLQPIKVKKDTEEECFK